MHIPPHVPCVYPCNKRPRDKGSYFSTYHPLAFAAGPLRYSLHCSSTFKEDPPFFTQVGNLRRGKSTHGICYLSPRLRIGPHFTIDYPHPRFRRRSSLGNSHCLSLTFGVSTLCISLHPLPGVGGSPSCEFYYLSPSGQLSLGRFATRFSFR